MTIEESFKEIDERDWFFLFWIAYFNQINKLNVNTPDLISKLKMSQQTISRRIIHLEQTGYIQRTFHKVGNELSLTPKAIDILRLMSNKLTTLFANQDVISGRLISGMGEGAYYIKNHHYLQQFVQKLGFQPYFGTLNIALDTNSIELFNYELTRHTPLEISGYVNGDRTYGNVYCYPAEIWPKAKKMRKVSCAVLKILRTSHRTNIIEIIAESFLRAQFSLHDEDELQFQLTS